MENGEFSRKWTEVKSFEDKRHKFLSAQLRSILGPFETFRERFPNMTPGIMLTTSEKFAQIMANSQNVREPDVKNASSTRSLKDNGERIPSVQKIVDKSLPVREKTKRPHDQSPDVAPPKVPKIEPKTILQQNPVDIKQPNRTSKVREVSNAITSYGTTNSNAEKPKVKTSQSQLKPYINNATRMNSSKERIAHERIEPSTSIAEKASRSEKSQHRTASKPESRPSSVTPHIPDQSPSLFCKPSTSPVARSSDQNISVSKPKLVRCKLPDYAIGEYVGYKIKITGKESVFLPEMVVSLNIKRMPTIKEIMSHVKKLIKNSPKNANDLTCNDMNRAFFSCGLMLYAVCQCSHDPTDNLLHEVVSILRTIRSRFFIDSLETQKLKNSTLVSAIFHLADAYVCEKLYTNQMAAARTRRIFMEEHKNLWSNVGENEQISVEALNKILEMKDKTLSKEILTDCTTNNMLHYQLLLEISQHAMLHERHVYAKNLARDLFQKTDKLLWNHLSNAMKMKLDGSSAYEIGDCIFSLIYWFNNNA
ncbi:hypothetical protein M3Y96_00843900 [Aphelenchoides besseyi]|nr:hypothetical protein M3Y96_00843900 [Aphelenchoides besseyi]